MQITALLSFQHIARILDHIKDNTVTAEELSIIIQWISDDPSKEKTHWLAEYLNTPANWIAGDPQFITDKEIPIRVLQADKLEGVRPAQIRQINFFRRGFFRYAAAIIILFAVGAYLWQTQKSSGGIAQTTPLPVQKDILPGSDKAILTLSNGQKIELNATAQQTITDGNLSINNKNGTLIYGKSEIVVYNTMSTPKGGQFKLTLPDGTNVWLNAESSITYPTSFPGNDRSVSITGEAYFEVVKNPSKPFTVKTYKNEITVLGTSFNVNSYGDEPVMKTSLLEGSVRIADKVLKPGQAYRDGKVVETNIDQDMAWKNGFFNFNGADLQDVMRQLSRWYDINVKYEVPVKTRKFRGELHRDLSLMQITSILKEMDVQFRLEGRTLFVH